MNLHDPNGEAEIVGARRLAGRLDGLYHAVSASFVTTPVEAVSFDFGGIVGDRHHGLTREAGQREPWYRRGVEMRNERQISIVSDIELAGIAAEMGIAAIEPQWIGANLRLSGIDRLSMLPAGTRLAFEGGAVLKIDGQNAPCRIAGAVVAERVTVADRAALSLAFVAAARRRRGLVAWVEMPGIVAVGATVTAHVPEQWLYR